MNETSLKMKYTLVKNTALSADVYEMVFKGDTTAFKAPGQFVNVQIPGKYLRRPISVCDYGENELTLLVKIVGDGTDKMCHAPLGTEFDMLTSLGNGFSTFPECKRPLLVGGGVGIAPLYNLCKVLIEEDKQVSVVLGFNAEKDIFYKDKFTALGAVTYIATLDGSVGTEGYVTDCIRQNSIAYDFIYTCGPTPMMKALYLFDETDGQYSLEERMGCGFGACMGCSIKTRIGYKRVCKDGPVFQKNVLLWGDEA